MVQFAIAVRWRLPGEEARSRRLRFDLDVIAPAGGQARSVLLNEPDGDTRAIYQMALAHAGYRVILAKDGQECVTLARRWRPDLVLTELFSRRLDGFGVRKALGTDPRTARIPVVAVTTCHLPRARQRAAGLGFAGYWLKPLDPRALVRDVERILGSAEARRMERPGITTRTLEWEPR